MAISSSIDIAEESMIIIHGSDGTILDVHHFVTAKGGKHPSVQEQEKAALDAAARCGTDIKKASVLRVAPHEFDLRKNYRVEPVARTLVETPRLTRRGQQA